MTTVAQVGGDHYGSAEYQHWDWAEEVGLGCMEYAATKYLARWRKKNGLQDLKKARSYVAKLMELNTNKSRVNPAVFVSGAFNRFCTLNDVTGRERDACLILNYWYSYRDLQAVLQVINDIIWDNFPEENQSRQYGDNILEWAKPTDPNEGEEDEHINE